MKKLFRSCFAPVWVVVGSLLVGQAFAGEKYNELDDAVAAMAKRWQNGGKAKVLMTEDGKLIFPFGQIMPKLTCSPTRACDVEMEPGENVNDILAGDGVQWTWKGLISKEKGKVIKHVVFQPLESAIETNAIITTDRRTYHLKLFAPKTEGAYLNRIGFYYPSEVVTSWAEKMGADAAEVTKEETTNVMAAPVSPDQFATDYRIDGKDSDFKPLHIFNDGEKVYMAMPESLRHGERPTFNIVDEKGNISVPTYREKINERTGEMHFIVDKLFSKGELRRGDEKVTITWKRKEKSFWDRMRSQ